jgi:predicted alpha/beta-fold hydrolase
VVDAVIDREDIDPARIALTGWSLGGHFGTDEGAGDHCEMRNRSLLDQRVFDWLDDVLGA